MPLFLRKQETDTLVEKGAIRESPASSLHHWSFTDVYSILIHLSQLNKFTTNERIQIENLMCVKHLLNPDDYIKFRLEERNEQWAFTHTRNTPSVCLVRTNLSVKSLNTQTKHSITNIWCNKYMV